MTLELIQGRDFISIQSDVDLLEAMAADDRADWALLVMVSCSGILTLVLAAASTLIA